MVTVRYKKLISGAYSVYLHYYLNGKPQPQQLEIYVSKDYSNGGKVRTGDQTKMELVRKIKAQKEQELIDLKEGAANTGSKEYQCLFDFIENSNKYQLKGKPSSMMKNIAAYTGKQTLPFSRITPKFIKGFFEYMEGQGLKRNTTLNYLWQMQAVLSYAKKTGVINQTPFARYKKPNKHDSDITYLDLKEIQQLQDTKNEVGTEVKRAFLFSCFTGLRFSEIRGLKFLNFQVEKDEEGMDITVLTIMPEKTDTTSGDLLRLPLSEQAEEIYKKQRLLHGEGYVFSKLPSLPTVKKKLAKWAEDAGIYKNIHFHVARHTFATLCISYGIDIYTVKEFLNHNSIEHTEVYAKLLNEKLKEEVQKFPDFMDVGLKESA